MRILFAGGQNQICLDALVHVGAKNILGSYYYFRKMSDSKTGELLSKMKENGMFTMIDSGAHTYFSFHGESLFHRKHIAASNKGVKSKGDSYVEPEVYVKEYTDWLVKWKDYFDVYVELDVGTIVGTEPVYEWRKMMLDRGLCPIPVMHFQYSEQKLGENAPIGEKLAYIKELWNEWLDEWPYLGVGGNWLIENYMDIICKPADAKKKKVHGFAMTRSDIIRKLTFYSVDSTSWMTGTTFGITFVLTGDKFKVYGPEDKSIRREYKAHCEKYNIDHNKLMADDDFTVNAFNASMWLEYQAVVDQAHRNDAIVKATGEAPEITLVAKPVERAVVQENQIGRWCNNCYIADRCPFFEQDATCSVFSAPVLNTGMDMARILKNLVSKAAERLEFAMASEMAKGGMLNPDVSKEIQGFVKLCERVKALSEEKAKVSITAEGPKGVGIIQKMFGGYGKGGVSKPSERLADDDGIVDLS